MSDQSSAFLPPDALPLPAAELALADRYVAGEHSPGDLATVRRHMDTDPARWTAIHALREAFIARAALGEPVVPVAEARAAFWNGVASHSVPGLRPTVRIPGAVREGPFRRWFRVGSVPVLGGLTAAAITAIVLSNTPSGGNNSRTVAPRRYATAAGERATITLTDGTVVRLGPATNLRVTTKAIDVDGEAFFAVTHRSHEPFVVRAGNTVTRVLGTRFIVRKYRGDHTPRIIVADGRVAVRVDGTAASAILSAGTLATVTDSGTLDVANDIVPSDQTTLIDGRFVFRDVPLADVVGELERAYDIKMQVADSVLAHRTITFTASVAAESLTDVLDFLSTALDAHYTRSGKTVTFAPGARASARPRQSPARKEAHYGR
jgi:transmembrane sensor